MGALRTSVLICLMLMTFSVCPAHGEDEEWTLFFTNPMGDRFYYDRRNIVYGRDKYVRVFERVSSGQRNSDYVEVASVVEFDCSKLLYRRLKTRMISRNGGAKEGVESAQWNGMQPGSAIQILSGEVCAKVPSGAGSDNQDP